MSQRPRDCGYRKSGVSSTPRNDSSGSHDDGDNELGGGVQGLAPHEWGGVVQIKKSSPNFLLFDTKKCPKTLEVSQFLDLFSEDRKGHQKTGQWFGKGLLTAILGVV